VGMVKTTTGQNGDKSKRRHTKTACFRQLWTFLVNF